MFSLIIFTALSSAVGLPNHQRTEFKNDPFADFVSREEWGANPATGPVTPLNTPAPYVVIHHTYIPAICLTRDDCKRDMRAMQNFHQNDNGWFDIGYNFAVGGEGSVYEGRGWETVGAHAAGTNSKSIGIAIIGDYRSSLPPAVALDSTKQLILEGVRRGFIRSDYKLVGHRQVSSTECPGDALFQEIRTWDHFTDDTDTEGDPFADFVSREEWGANPATGPVTPLNTPAPYVVIHHTYIPAICLTRDDCMRDMRAMQNFHQNDNGWFDIGYNFAVGGEGSVYEGRGWETVGAHAAGTNSKSIGIAIIGDYRSSLPPAVALASTKQLILEGVRRGFIRSDYKLVGHRQVSSTECPGDALFQEIRTWDHFTDDTDTEDNSFSFVTRATWGANPPRSVTGLNTPVTHVVIHHSAVPEVCMTRDQCMRDMRSMQNSHQNGNGWADIGYNFAVGGEGSVYEGRGWETVGAHSAGFNSQSIGIVIIGNYVSQLPPTAALQTAQQLIASGVQRGYIRPDYRLIGHRQVTATECPGNTLYREIQTWDRFSFVV